MSVDCNIIIEYWYWDERDVDNRSFSHRWTRRFFGQGLRTERIRYPFNQNNLCWQGINFYAVKALNLEVPIMIAVLSFLTFALYAFLFQIWVVKRKLGSKPQFSENRNWIRWRKAHLLRKIRYRSDVHLISILNCFSLWDLFIILMTNKELELLIVCFCILINFALNICSILQWNYMYREGVLQKSYAKLFMTW